MSSVVSRSAPSIHHELAPLEAIPTVVKQNIASFLARQDAFAWAERTSKSLRAANLVRLENEHRQRLQGLLARLNQRARWNSRPAKETLKKVAYVALQVIAAAIALRLTPYVIPPLTSFINVSIQNGINTFHCRYPGVYRTNDNEWHSAYEYPSGRPTWIQASDPSEIHKTCMAQFVLSCAGKATESVCADLIKVDVTEYGKILSDTKTNLVHAAISKQNTISLAMIAGGVVLDILAAKDEQRTGEARNDTILRCLKIVSALCCACFTQTNPTPYLLGWAATFAISKIVGVAKRYFFG